MCSLIEEQFHSSFSMIMVVGRSHPHLHTNKCTLNNGDEQRDALISNKGILEHNTCCVPTNTSIYSSPFAPTFYLEISLCK